MTFSANIVSEPIMFDYHFKATEGPSRTDQSRYKNGHSRLCPQQYELNNRY